MKNDDTQECIQEMFDLVKRRTSFSFRPFSEDSRRNELEKFLEHIGYEYINVVDEDKNNLLHNAVAKGYVGIVGLLLLKGIDQNAKNKSKQTALDIAKENNNKKIIDILMKFNSDASDSIPSTSGVGDQLAKININAEESNEDDSVESDNDMDDLTKISYYNNNSTCYRDSSLFLSGGNNLEGGNLEHTNNNDNNDNEDNRIKRSAETQMQSSNPKKSKARDSSRDKEKFPGGDKTLNEHGSIFQVKLLMLCLCRAYERKYEKFRLATELKYAEKFDDVAFQYFDGYVWKFRLLQAKHQEPADDMASLKTIKLNDLQSLNSKNNFSLQKYFHSYLKIKKRCQEKSVYSVFSDCEIEDVVLLTNTDISNDVKGSLIPIDLDDNDIFKVDNEVCMTYQINNDNTTLLKSLKLIVEDTSDFNILIETLTDHLVNNKPMELTTDIFKDYYYALLYNVFKEKESISDKSVYLRIRDDFLNLQKIDEFRDHFVKEVAFRQFFKDKTIKNIERLNQFGTGSDSQSQPDMIPDDDKILQEIAETIVKNYTNKEALAPSDFKGYHVAFAKTVFSVQNKKFDAKLFSPACKRFRNVFLKSLKKVEANTKMKDLKSLEFSFTEDFGKLTLPDDLNILNNLATAFLKFISIVNCENNEAILKKYYSVLESKVVDVGEKKFNRKFVANADLSLNLRIFRKLLILQIIKDTDVDNAVTYLKGSRIRISKSFLKNSIQRSCKIENPNYFAHQLEKIIRKHIQVKEDTVIEINDYSVASVQLSTFKKNVFRLKGHVLVNYFKKVRISSVFLNGDIQLEQENLRNFRNELRRLLGNSDFENLFNFEFDIQFKDFFTCEEGAIYLNLPSRHSEDDIREFLGKLKFIVNYPNRKEINKILKKDIGKTFERFDVDAIYANFYEKIHDWMSDRMGTFLTYDKMEELFDNIKKSLLPWILDTLNQLYLSSKTCLQFENCDKVINFLKSKNQILCFNCSNRIIGSSRITQTFKFLKDISKALKDYTNNDGHIFVHIKNLVSFFEEICLGFSNSDNFNLLVIEFDNKFDGEYVTEMYEYLSKYPHKKLILIGKKGELNIFSEKLRHNAETYDDNTTYGNLTEESKEDLLKRGCIIFQGHENKISFMDIIGESDMDVIKRKFSTILNNFFTLDLLGDCLNAKDIEIGRKLKSTKDIDGDTHYINRSLYHPTILSFVKFKKGVDEGELLDMCVIYNTRIEFSRQTVFISHKQKREEAGNIFKEKCKLMEGPVHLLKKFNNLLIKIDSKGPVDNLIKYKADSKDLANFKEEDPERDIKEEALTDLSLKGDKVVLIADIAGMGKSATLTHLGTSLKENYPRMWIIGIDLIKYINVLEKEKKDREKANKGKRIEKLEWAHTFLVDKLLDSFEDSRLNNFEKELFRYNLELRSKVVLLFDDFDLISGYDDIIIDLIKALRDKVEKIYVATRPNMRDLLENELKVFCYMFRPFTREDSMEYLNKYWRKKIYLLGVEKIDLKMDKYAKAIMVKLDSSLTFQEKEFLGIPLLTKLIAVIFLKSQDETWQGCQDFLNNELSTEPHLPQTLDLVWLFNKFIRNAQERDYSRSGVDPKNVKTRQQIEKEEHTFHEEHQTLALSVLFRGKSLDQLVHFRKRKAAVIKENNEKRGLVSEIDKFRPTFVHQTFAEYFVAEFVKEKIKQSKIKGVVRVLYSRILFLPQYRMVRIFLYSMNNKNQLKDETLPDVLQNLKEYDKKIDDLNIFEKILSVRDSDQGSKKKIKDIIDLIKSKLRNNHEIENLVTGNCIKSTLDKDMVETYDILLEHVESPKKLKNLLVTKFDGGQIFKIVDNCPENPFKTVVEKHIARLSKSDRDSLYSYKHT